MSVERFTNSRARPHTDPPTIPTASNDTGSENENEPLPPEPLKLIAAADRLVLARSVGRTVLGARNDAFAFGTVVGVDRIVVAVVTVAGRNDLVVRTCPVGRVTEGGGIASNSKPWSFATSIVAIGFVAVQPLVLLSSG